MIIPTRDPGDPRRVGMFFLAAMFLFLCWTAWDAVVVVATAKGPVVSTVVTVSTSTKGVQRVVFRETKRGVERELSHLPWDLVFFRVGETVALRTSPATPWFWIPERLVFSTIALVAVRGLLLIGVGIAVEVQRRKFDELKVLPMEPQRRDE